MWRRISDRGVQYASNDYQQLLKKNGFLLSMSGKGNCYDYAPAETFFSTIKNELVFLTRFRTRTDARQAISEYIEIHLRRLGAAKRNLSLLSFHEAKVLAAPVNESLQ